MRKIVRVGLLTAAAAAVVGGGYALTSGQTTQADCDIKGNVSMTTGERIYHRPGDLYYEKTEVDRSAGEKMFCSDGEAEAAGWRRSKV